MRIWRFLLAGLLAFAPVAATTANAGPAQLLDLGDGYQFLLIGAGDTPARVANPKTIFINVALKDEKIHADHAKLIEAADRLFETVLMGAAEKGYYKLATINIQKPGTAAKPEYEDFLYKRADNEVWLRQAGTAPWKTAQDPKWAAPAAEKVEVKPFGTFAVEGALEIAAPEGFTRAAEIDFVTATPLIDLQRKYQEIKALWARIDRAKMKADGFDMVLIGNFTESQRGRFHARKGFFVRIPREDGGDWPELPDRAPDDRDLLISKNEVATGELTRTIAEAFAGRGEAMRLTQLIAALPSAAVAQAAMPGATAASVLPAPPTLAQVGFAEGLAVIKLNPNIFVVKFQ